MICIHHNKDLDGYCSGAVVRRKYPDCKLIGWDYGQPLPDFKEMVGEDVVMIDISFPIPDILRLSDISRLTIIDHHISFKKEVDQLTDNQKDSFKYIYQLGIAACEIGWKYFFPDEKLPRAVELLGKYDTWRKDEEWDEFVLPFQYGMRQICTDPLTFPMKLLEGGSDYEVGGRIVPIIDNGKAILSYQEQQDMLACQRSSFEIEFEGLRAICLNQGAFSSNTLQTVYDPEKHDVMVGFQYNGKFWNVSLRSAKDEVDVSVIAKSRGGGGHKAAAGFEAKTFEEIFDKDYKRFLIPIYEQ